MVLYNKFFEQFPNFQDKTFESKYDIAKELSIYNDQHILNYSDLDILQLSNEIISKLQLNMDDFDIPNLRIIEAINLYKEEPAEFYEKYSEMRKIQNDNDNFITLSIFESDESGIEIVIDKNNGNIALWEEVYCVIDEFDIQLEDVKSVDDLVNSTFAMSKFEINNIDDLNNALETCDIIDYFDNNLADYESIDELIDSINEELKELGFKELGFKPLTKNVEKER